MLKSSFTVDKADESPGFLLWQVTMIWQRKIKQVLEPYGISHAQFVILANLLWFSETKQRPTQTLLVNMSKLDKMTVSTSIKSLVQKGLLAREVCAVDTRAKLVKLTRQGNHLAKTLVPIVEAVDAQFFGMLKVSERKSLIRCLSSVVNNTA